MTPDPVTYPGYHFPAEIISHAVWLHHLFGLSLRDVELTLAERGITVTHESIRSRCRKFGSELARKLRRRRPKPGDTWHLDEVFLRNNGVLHYLWRAVDQHGVVLDILVQDRRNESAAKWFFKRLLAGLRYKPRRLITDRLKSYGVAQRELLPEVRHRSIRYLNNRAENSHRPTRRRERQMQRFKSAGQAQRFLSAHSMIYGHFRPRRHLMTAGEYRRARTGSGGRKPVPKRPPDPAAPPVTRLNSPSRQTTRHCRCRVPIHVTNLNRSAYRLCCAVRLICTSPAPNSRIAKLKR
jgi:putative transposase